MLYDVDAAQLAYCLVDTPEHLIPDWEEDIDKYFVSHIDARLRVTTLDFERDKELEEQIKYKIAECKRYYNWYHEQFLNKNQ